MFFFLSAVSQHRYISNFRSCSSATAAEDCYGKNECLSSVFCNLKQISKVSNSERMFCFGEVASKREIEAECSAPFLFAQMLCAIIWCSFFSGRGSSKSPISRGYLFCLFGLLCCLKYTPGVSNLLFPTFLFSGNKYFFYICRLETSKNTKVRKSCSASLASVILSPTSARRTEVLLFYLSSICTSLL